MSFNVVSGLRQVAVVGGGTAGISAVAALAPHHHVLWCD
jgi:predicted NAD/FAD-binding protein